tara:strand:+ start:935 stop:1462 length:528 start_codon:yes stop_codon:yes gene_type:complete
MRKHKDITVLGRNNIRLPFTELREYGPIISVGNHKHNATLLDYVWTRQENELLWFLQQRPSPVECVTTPELYKKYVFYDQVHSFPPISPQFNLTLDINTDDQTLALLSALGLSQERILLVGYDLANMKSLKDLRSIIMLHPHRKFYFLCSPPKTKQLDYCSNAECVLFKDMEKLK